MGLWITFCLKTQKSPKKSRKSALEDFYDKVIIGGEVDIKNLDKHYTAKYAVGKYPDYPVMKLLDAALWEYDATL